MRQVQFSRVFDAVVAVLLAIPIVFYSYVGTFSRYMTDDFCIVNSLATSDVLSETLLWYNTWGGRLSQPLTLLTAFELGQVFPAVSPALLIALWAIALGWAAVEFARWLGLARPVVRGIMIALLVIYATLAGTPQLGQSLYWMSAAYAYTAPLPLFALLLALTFRAARTGRASLWVAVVSALIAFVVGSFAEPVVTFEVMALLLLLVGFWWWDRRNRAVQGVLVAQVIGAVIALLLILLSPGNAIREVNFEASPSILNTLIMSFVDGVSYLLLFAPTLSLGAVLGSVGIAALIGLYFPSRLSQLPARRVLLLLLGWLIANVAMSAAFMAPGVHATNAPPPARSLIIIQFNAIVLYVGVGFLFGVLLRTQMRRKVESWRPLGVGIALVLLVTAPLATTLQFRREAAIYAQFAREWDRDDQLLRAAERDALVSLPPFTVDVAVGLGLDSLTTDADSWVNQCVATYYGVDAVTIAESS